VEVIAGKIIPQLAENLMGIFGWLKNKMAGESPPAI
jgi:hypothetical protein